VRAVGQSAIDSAMPRSTPSSREWQGSAEATVKHQPRSYTKYKWSGRARTRDQRISKWKISSITVTAHTYADLFDEELDDIAAALDALGERE